MKKKRNIVYSTDEDFVIDQENDDSKIKSSFVSFEHDDTIKQPINNKI